MESTIEMRMQAEPETVFRLAAAVEDWPLILPHYRWVRVLAVTSRHRVVEMAARRDFYPVRWTAVLEPDPLHHRLRFIHIGGPARGMKVEWRIVPVPGGSLVTIWHRLDARIPLVGEMYARDIVGRLFVHSIARKTLGRMRQIVEGRG